MTTGPAHCPEISDGEHCGHWMDGTGPCCACKLAPDAATGDDSCPAVRSAEDDDETDLTCWLPAGHGGVAHFDSEYGIWTADGAR